jgi:parallel beta-helix repeat protein
MPSMRSDSRVASRYVNVWWIPWILSMAVVASLILFPLQARADGAILSVNNAPGCSPTGAGGAPYCTISEAVAVVQPGQTIQVATGTYPESVTVSKAGTPSAPIVLTTAPGGSVTITGDGTSARALTVSAQYVQVNGFNVLSHTKQDVYVSASNVTVSNMSVSQTSSHGIYVSGSSGSPLTNVTLTGNVATVAGLPNIDYSHLAAGIYLKYTTNSTVTQNTADADTLAGIYLGTGTANITATRNVTFNNAAGTYSGNPHGLAPGIDSRTGPNLIIRNLSYSNEDSGLQFYTGAHDNVVTDNLSFNNGDHGIDDLNAPDQIIVGNTIYNSMHSTRTTSNIRVDSTSITGAVVDYNNVLVPRQNVCGTNNSSSCVEYIWGKTGYSSLAAFQTATGQEVHGKEADPLFTAPGSGDFRLQARSPAIDDANSAVAGWQTSDYAGNARVDDPATPNVGVGPRSYDDRGALEYQPNQSDSPPTAALTVTPSSGTAPLPVTADASASTDTDATPIASYTFNFGDGSAAVGPQPGATATYTYSATGTFTVTVTVTDTAGLSSTATAQVSVKANLVSNPGFELATTGWNTSGSGSASITLARVSGGHSGSYSGKLSNTGTTAATCVLNDSPNWVGTTSAGIYTGSIWVRADSGGATLRLRFREYAGATLMGSQTSSITLSTSWQQITVAYAPVSPGSSTLDFNAYVSSAAVGTCFYADDAVITLG